MSEKTKGERLPILIILIIFFFNKNVPLGHEAAEDRHGPDGRPVHVVPPGREGTLPGTDAGHRLPPLRECRRRWQTVGR